MTFDQTTLPLLAEAVRLLEEGYRSLPSLPEPSPASREAIGQVLRDVAGKLSQELPYHHPLYIGQMLKPPHPVARLAYGLAQFLNLNNHALDGGRTSSTMEKEAVAELAQMVGFPVHLGHLTSGGTFANLEALWIARELRPGQAVAASAQAHYTHRRVCGVLGVPFVEIPCDQTGRMDIEALEEILPRHRVGTVVATLGTTAAGAVDPLADLLPLRERFGFRLHVDAAYGGYFKLCSILGPAAQAAFARMDQADSLVIDPHKHGLQPYGCGCVLFRDPAVGRFYRHDSPYTYFTSNELHLGEISLECSRPGAAAVALWATQRLLPLVPGGQFAQGLDAGRRAALGLAHGLQGEGDCVPFLQPELDIVVWTLRADSASRSSALARQAFGAAARQGLHLALANFPRNMVEPSGAIAAWDTDTVTCLRAVAMKPEHEGWLPDILARWKLAQDSLR